MNTVSKAAADLQTWCPELLDLATNFVDRGVHLNISTFYEMQTLNGVIVSILSFLPVRQG